MKRVQFLWSRVRADGDGVVAMAGAVPLRMLADQTGLTAALSQALTRADFQPVYDRGRVLVDVACAIGCGASDIVDVEALRAQEQLFGQVASDTTCGRALAEAGQAGRGQLAPHVPGSVSMCGACLRPGRHR